MTDNHDGFVLCEDKNTQEIKVYLYKFNYKEVEPYIARLEKVQYYKHRLETKGKLVQRHEKCTGYRCKMAEQCPMREVCYERKKEKLQ